MRFSEWPSGAPAARAKKSVEPARAKNWTSILPFAASSLPLQGSRQGGFLGLHGPKLSRSVDGFLTLCARFLVRLELEGKPLSFCLHAPWGAGEGNLVKSLGEHRIGLRVDPRVGERTLGGPEKGVLPLLKSHSTSHQLGLGSGHNLRCGTSSGGQLRESLRIDVAEAKVAKGIGEKVENSLDGGRDGVHGPEHTDSNHVVPHN